MHNIACLFHSNLLGVSSCKIGLDCVRYALRAFLKQKFFWRPPDPPPLAGRDTFPTRDTVTTSAVTGAGYGLALGGSQTCNIWLP